VLHGPDARRVEGAVRSDGQRPFHGIASQGFVQALGPGGGEVWREWAPCLDAALGGDATLPEEAGQAARACEVLTFEMSVAAAEGFVGLHLPELLRSARAPWGAGEVAATELWNLKEGHMASVWRLTVRPDGDRAPIHLALNVARDAPSSAALDRSTAALRDIEQRSTHVPVARVLLADRVAVSGPYRAEPLVLAQEWVDDARELGFMRPRGRGGACLCAVDLFLTGDASPAEVVGALGRPLDPTEHERAAYQAMGLLIDCARLDAASGAVVTPWIDVRCGDWMWGTRGLHVVAAGEPEVVVHGGAAGALAGLWPPGGGRGGDLGPTIRAGAERAIRDARAAGATAGGWM
jgi:hypothetical protein